MQAAMTGRDSLTVLPTGGGKSLCYQAPAICRSGMAVVVSPLIALMKDQVDALTECGIPAAFVNSSLSNQERLEIARRVRADEIKLLFAAPERLVQQRTIDFLSQTQISFVAIDEAHCISKWGHDFRPEYRQMSCLRDAFPNVSMHAFTATATEKVRIDIVNQLGLRSPEVLVGNFDRPNLMYRVERRQDLMDQIQAVIDRHPQESGIVYCISRANVEGTAAALRRLGYNALPYHAGLDPEDRRKHQEAFIDEKVDIIVATVAFGMGIDKSNVRYVIHSEMPASIEAYQQESGRAGRDGLEAECHLIYSGRDVSTWEFLINQSENAENRRVSLAALKQMEAFCFSSVCRHQQLVRHFGQQLQAKAGCGACDVCLEEIEPQSDSLVTSQKIISSVYRQEQRFGAEYTAQVLRGSRGKKILHNRHDQLTTYGLLKDEPNHVVRGWIDQLVAQGFLMRMGEHSVLGISEAGLQVLRGLQTPVLTRPKTSSTAGKTAVSSSTENKWDGVHRGLFEDLRQWRMQIATQRGVPPYVIFGDMTLRELARFRPTRPGNLLSIYGVGQQKQTEFGQSVLERIQRYSEDHDLKTDLGEPVRPAASKPAAARDHASRKDRKQQSVSRTSDRQVARQERSEAAAERYFELFDQGLSLQEVALQMDRSTGTVVEYLAKFIRARNVDDATRWVSADVVQQVERVIEKIGPYPLNSVFDALKQTVTYDDIRIIIATRKVRQP